MVFTSQQGNFETNKHEQKEVTSSHYIRLQECEDSKLEIELNYRDS